MENKSNKNKEYVPDEVKKASYLTMRQQTVDSLAKAEVTERYLSRKVLGGNANVRIQLGQEQTKIKEFKAVIDFFDEIIEDEFTEDNGIETPLNAS